MNTSRPKMLNIELFNLITNIIVNSNHKPNTNGIFTYKEICYASLIDAVSCKTHLICPYEKENTQVKIYKSYGGDLNIVVDLSIVDPKYEKHLIHKYLMLFYEHLAT